MNRIYQLIGLTLVVCAVALEIWQPVATPGLQSSWLTLDLSMLLGIVGLVLLLSFFRIPKGTFTRIGKGINNFKSAYHGDDQPKKKT